MSWTMATLNAYDVMGAVHVTAVVRTTEHLGAEPKETVMQCSTTYPGVGEDDQIEWLRDVLVGLLEAL